jgi:fatty acid amide hydrolase
MFSKPINLKVLSYGLLCSYAGFQLYSYLKTRYIRYKLNIKAKNKRRLRDSSSPLLDPIPKEIEDFVLSQSASDLAQAIRSGRITSVQAVSVYIHRAYTIGRDHCLTAEELFGPALASAHECDAELAQGKLRGPLHGVPFSVKDHFAMVGCTSSGGVTWKLDHPDQETALAVTLLVEQGAIPFVRSNVPPAMMWCETSSKTYGRAQNPWDRSRTVGGSSGGEGGLVAARCSPLGIGSDIARSLRIPSAFCGIYTIKPTPERMPFRGLYTGQWHNQEPMDAVVKVSIGPLGRCTEDLVQVLRIWLSSRSFQLDPTIVPLSFNEAAYNSTKKLKIGYFTSFPYFDAAECVVKSIAHCAEVLSNQCEVVPFELPEMQAMFKTFSGLFQANGNESLLASFQGEEPEPYYKLGFWLSDHPYLAKLAASVLKCTGNQRIGAVLDVDSNISSSAVIALYQAAQDLREIVTKEWARLGLDAVICPMTGIVAPRHDTTPDVFPGVAYGTFWNLLRFPSGIVPAGLITEKEAKFEDRFNDLMTTAAKECMRNSEGLPYVVQVVGLPYTDETVLRVMGMVEQVFGFHKSAL